MVCLEHGLVNQQDADQFYLLLSLGFVRRQMIQAVKKVVPGLSVFHSMLGL
jgi:hypothetical protein